MSEDKHLDFPFLLAFQKSLMRVASYSLMLIIGFHQNEWKPYEEKKSPEEVYVVGGFLRLSLFLPNAQLYENTKILHRFSNFSTSLGVSAAEH